MRLLYWYLRMLLFLEFADYVYELSGRWDENAKQRPRRGKVAWAIQEDLLKRGFHKCPSCGWATKSKDEHIAKGKGYCYEQSLEPMNDSVDDLLDRAEAEYLHHGPDSRTW